MVFGKKDAEKSADVRDCYDASYFRGRGLAQTRGADGDLLWNLLVQGEVSRLNADEGRYLLLKELRQLVETQTAILDTQKAILDELRKR